MPTEDAYSSGHLVLSHFGTYKCFNVETNVSWTCLVSGLLSFEHPSVLLFLLTTADGSNIFFIEPIYKIGNMLGVCHGWFHLQGLPRAVRNASRARITKWKILAHCGIRTRDLPLTKRRCYHWATRTNVCRVDKSSPGFNCTIFRNLPAAHGRCSKIICRELHFVNSLQTANRYKYYMTKIHDKLFCFI